MEIVNSILFFSYIFSVTKQIRKASDWKKWNWRWPNLIGAVQGCDGSTKWAVAIESDGGDVEQSAIWREMLAPVSKRRRFGGWRSKN